MRAPAVPQVVQERVPDPLFCRHCVPDCVPGQVYAIPPNVVVPPITIPFDTLTPCANVEEADAESPVNVEKPAWVIPPANVDVPVLVMLRSPEERIFPPEIVRPALDARPPVEIPPAKVEVPGPTLITLANVEDAATKSEEEAFNCPLTSRFEEKVDEAVEESPPVSERRVEVAELEFT